MISYISWWVPVVPLLVRQTGFEPILKAYKTLVLTNYTIGGFVAFNLLSQWQLLLCGFAPSLLHTFPSGSLSETILTNKEGESLICNPFIVGRVGLEPTPLSGPDFESGAYT